MPVPFSTMTEESIESYRESLTKWARGAWPTSTVAMMREDGINQILTLAKFGLRASKAKIKRGSIVRAIEALRDIANELEGIKEPTPLPPP